MYVFDLDGTIALNAHRQHHLLPPAGHVPGEYYKKDWDAFTMECHKDIPDKPVIEIMASLQAHSPVVIVSGRGMKAHELTLQWLADHFVPYHSLYMRPIGDHRDDCELKLEMLKRAELEYGVTAKAIFDDRQKVVNMWRREGYVCCQVAPGDF